MGETFHQSLLIPIADTLLESVIVKLKSVGMFVSYQDLNTQPSGPQTVARLSDVPGSDVIEDRIN